MKWIDDVLDVLEDKRIIKMRPACWKARLSVSLVILIFSSIGIFLSTSTTTFAWEYWRIIVPCFAVICIWLSWYVSKSHEINGINIWHEVLHWLALLLAVYIVSTFVHNNLVTSMIGALFISVLLALTLFLAGVYFDGMFMILGIVLGLLAIASAYFVKYMTLIVIIAAILAALFIIWRFMLRAQRDGQT